ncbi:MAG: N-acetylmuramoyl-L-alanine amidase [Deltaproteobacteria bacterium]|nr:N-acetylmuramoyl-L-alanine amidase [Deltaproteobacteria bacterium]
MWKMSAAVVALVGSGAAIAQTGSESELWARAVERDRAVVASARATRGDWRPVIAGYERLLARFPMGPRAADALLRLAQLEWNFYQRWAATRDERSAVARLRRLLTKHEKSPSAREAWNLLATASPKDPLFRRRGAARIDGVSINATGEKTARVTLSLDRPTTYERGSVPADDTGPLRVFLDVARAVLGPKAAPVESALGPVARVRFGDHLGNVRVVLDLRIASARVVVRPHGATVTVDVSEEAPPVARAVQAGPIRRIIIDAGHGGIDGGAVGRRYKTREKVVTLAMARLTADKLRERGFEVELTRDDDKYVSLEDRTTIANRENGDLFISIHANWNPSRKRQGVETYVLNLSDDRYAEKIARRENGPVHRKGRRKGKARVGSGSNLNFILADLATRASVAESSRIAKLIHDEIVRGLSPHFGKVPGHGVRQALFYVLVGTKMPAVLVETSHLSNAIDEARLRSLAYQTGIAEAIARAVVAYSNRADRVVPVAPVAPTGSKG